MVYAGPLNIEKWRSIYKKYPCDGCSEKSTHTYSLKSASAYLRFCYGCAVRIDTGELKISEPKN